MSMKDKAMKKSDEMRAEYSRKDLGNGVRGKHCAGLDGKSMLPVRPEDTESFLAAVAGTLSNDFPNDITDDDLDTDAPRHELG